MSQDEPTGVLSTMVLRDFAGAERRFQLHLGEIRELEQACKAGIGAIYVRVATGQFTIDDMRQTIRLGLVGGGLDRVEAEALVRFEFEDASLNRFHPLAVDTLRALFEGVDREGNFGGVRPDGQATSAPSTPSAPPPASTRERSMQ